MGFILNLLAEDMYLKNERLMNAKGLVSHVNETWT